MFDFLISVAEKYKPMKPESVIEGISIGMTFERSSGSPQDDAPFKA
jgi:hypothetical protein